VRAGSWRGAHGEGAGWGARQLPPLPSQWRPPPWGRVTAVPLARRAGAWKLHHLHLCMHELRLLLLQKGTVSVMAVVVGFGCLLSVFSQKGRGDAETFL